MQEHYGYFQRIDMDKIREERRRAADIQETSQTIKISMDMTIEEKK